METKKNKLSHTRLQTYLTCPYKYWLYYDKKLRPKATKSALVFGAAMDEALNELLQSKDLDKSKERLSYKLNHPIVNDTPIILAENLDLIKFSKTDLQPALSEDPIKCLELKGNILLDEYNKKIIPKIKEVISVQETIKIENEDGDSIIGIIDMIVKWKDNKTYLLDNKTTSVKYDKDSPSKSDQLLLYHLIKQSEVDIDKIGFIVLNKKIRKDLSCDIDVILKPTSKISLDSELEVLKKFNDVNEGIHKREFKRNYKNCRGVYGYCDYFNYCHKKDDSNLISKSNE